MAKKAKHKPSGDPLDKDAVSVTDVHEDDAVALPVAEPLPAGHLYVDLVTKDRLPYKRVAVPSNVGGGFKLIYEGRAYNHVADAPDGVWIYAED